MGYYNSKGEAISSEDYMKRFSTGGSGLQVSLNRAYMNAQQAAVAPIEQQELNDIAETNSRQSAVLNDGALAQTRRRAGGTTFRRRGSAVSANQLVSGLGVSNVKALAQQRRAVALQGANTTSIGFKVGKPVGTSYY